MKSIGTFKLHGSLSHSIGMILYSLLAGFGTYLIVVDQEDTTGIIVLDIYVGIVGIIFSVIGIFAVCSMNEICLDLVRGYTIISSLFNIFFTVLHTIIPLYNDFNGENNTLVNLFYVAASGFVISFIQNLYSFYISASLIKIKRAELTDKDIESLGDESPIKSLNDTDISYR